jgi:hypothetical protein
LRFILCKNDLTHESPLMTGSVLPALPASTPALIGLDY